MPRQPATFDRAVRQLVAPVLVDLGFRGDRGRTFRRVSGDGTAAEIIDFQRGQRSLAGRFTVNLGVFFAGDAPAITVGHAREYHCAPARRARLGLLAPPAYPRLAAVPILGVFFQPKDTWWRFGPDYDQTGKRVSVALRLLMAEGIPWLERVRHGPSDGRGGSATAVDQSSARS